ncbi:MAG: hypothetical protein M1830_001952 [Pleopsidium flavum]|nr:MAG: hypothetical protein M1830_001952 [Pleopsidium flavum]
MAIWPFGRKNKTKRSSRINDTISADAEEKLVEATSRNSKPPMAGGHAPTLGRKPSRKESQRRKRDTSKKLSKAQQHRSEDPEKDSPVNARATTMPTSAGYQAQQYSDEKSRLPANVERRGADMNSAPTNRGDDPTYYFQNPTSQSSLQPEQFTALGRPPTLGAKRSANDTNLPRRKSSKRRAEDHAREQEVKAMSVPIPVPKRPITHTGGPLRRDTKKIHGGLNRHLERPTSEISLPLPQSMHSSVSEASEQRAFKVRSLDVFSPRPTIRYSDNSRYTAGSSSLGPSRTSTRRDKRPVIPDEAIKQKKRVEDLADDMDATGLRELMERDQRRREKKRQSDQEKLHRKLQRKADKQKEEVKQGRERTDSAASRNSERRVLGREETGLVGDTSAVHVEERMPINSDGDEVRKSPESWLQDPSKEHLPPENPFVDPVQETTRTEVPTPAEELEEPVIGTAQAVRLSQASMSPPTSPRDHVLVPTHLSAVTDLPRQSISEIPQRSEPDRRSSDTSGRAAGSWTSFFRRGGARGKRNSADRGRITPSEFSNTSRESFARQPPPVSFQRNVRTRSGTPVRTQSKFREDLPELPISPPDSRVHSPEAILQSRSPHPDRTVSPLIETSSDAPLEDIHPAFRQEVAQIRQQTIEAPSPDGDPSSALLSQSLASVDSEGSWLSGRPVKRTSQQQSNPQRGSIGSLQKRLDEFSNSDEELGVTEDEYFSRLHPGLAEHRGSEEGMHGGRKASSTAIADDSDTESAMVPPILSKEEGTWHSAVGRQPTIVRQGARAKSREGLLNDFQAVEDSDESSPTTGEAGIASYELSGPNAPFVQRATSVDFGKAHVRHISAGSAKLLDLPPKSPVDAKRLSSASGERSPLSGTSPRPDAATTDTKT